MHISIPVECVLPKRKTCLREGVEIENREKYSNNFISVWQKSGFAVATWLRGPGFEGPILLDFVFAFSRANSKSNKTENCVCAPDPPSLTHYSNTRDGWKNKCDMIWQFCGTRNRSRVNVCFMLLPLLCFWLFCSLSAAVLRLIKTKWKRWGEKLVVTCLSFRLREITYNAVCGRNVRNSNRIPVDFPRNSNWFH